MKDSSAHLGKGAGVEGDTERLLMIQTSGGGWKGIGAQMEWKDLNWLEHVFIS